MHKLGCFGIPSIFSFSSQTCAKCAEFSECQQSSHAALKSAPIAIVGALLEAHEQYEHEHSLDTLPPKQLTVTKTAPKTTRDKRAKRFPLTQEQKTLLASITNKAAATFIEKLFVRGLQGEIANAAKECKSAFTEEKHRPYHLALSMLFKFGFTKPVLRSAYENVLGWSKQSAATQVSITWGVLIALGLAEERGIALVASPKIITENRQIRYQEVTQW